MAYQLTLEKADVQLILGALAELPIKVAGGTFSKVQNLVMLQDAATAAAAQDAPKVDATKAVAGARKVSGPK